jgi:hypothetical protein
VFGEKGTRRLYAYVFAASELRDLLTEAGYRDIRLRGLIVLSGRVTWPLPGLLSIIETWCSTFPYFAGISRFIVAPGSGEQPGGLRDHGRSSDEAPGDIVFVSTSGARACGRANR